MLSIEQCRKILNRPELTDEQIAEIRDALYCFAHALIDDYVRQRRASAPLTQQCGLK